MRYRRFYENSLIIAPDSRKAEILAYRRFYPLANLRIVSREEFLSRGDYRYDERAEKFLIQEGYSLSASREILKAFARLDPKKEYKSEKINGLLPLFSRLKDLNYLFKDYYPDGDIKGKHLVISGYHDGLAISKSLENERNLDTLFDILPKKEDYPAIIECPSILEECHQLCTEIASRISQGVSPNDIYIANCDSSYYFTLSLFARHYGFSIAFPSNETYFSSPIGEEFLSLYDTGASIEEALSSMKGSYEDSVFTAFALLLRQYEIVGLEKRRQREVYIDLLKSNRPASKLLYPSVKLLSGYYAPEGSYVYFVNFSLGNAPKNPAEPSFFKEDDLVELGFPSAIEKAKENKTELLGLLLSKGLERVYYHAKDFDQSLPLSPLVNELGLILIPPIEFDVERSRVFALLLGQDMEDRFLEYGILDPRHDRYYDPSIPRYDNSFTLSSGAATYSPYRYSFSSISSFYRCPFSYFVSYVLKLPPDPSKFSSRAGVIYHAVLKERFDEATSSSFDFEKAFEKALREEEHDLSEGGEFTNKEKALLLQMKEDLKKIIAYIENKESQIEDPHYHCEFKLEAATQSGVRVYGFVDKAITFAKERYIALFDYKTYAKGFDGDLAAAGVDLQLPIYAFLLKNSPEYKDFILAGAYYSKVIFSSKDRGFDSVEDYGKDLRLDGMFLSEDDSLSKFGIAYEYSDYISGTVKKKDGTFRNETKPKSAQFFDDLSVLAENKIEEADRRIKAFDFPIAPLYMGKKLQSCDNCTFRKYCYRKSKDIVYLGLSESAEEDEDA